VTDSRPDTEPELRIGLLCHSSVGGSARVAAELGRELGRRRHDVHLITRFPPALLRRDSSVVVHTLHTEAELSPRLDVVWSAGEQAAFVEFAADVCRAHRLDVLHFHYGLPFAEVADAVRRRLDGNAPAIVGTLHGTDVARETRPRLTMLDSLDAVTTVSYDHARRALTDLALDRRPQVIPNTIDPSRFHRAAAPPTRRRPPRILHVSNFRAVKDPERVARAFAAVRRRHEARLWLVGDGEEMPAVRAVLRAAGVSGDVLELGLRTDVESIYNRCDIVVLTSRQESFSMVALEAAASGVPVVAPAVGGLPEIIRDGRTGLLYDLADNDEPARSILRLREDDRARAAMGRAAWRLARAFSHDLGVPRYERLYRDVLEQRRREPASLPGALAAR